MRNDSLDSIIAVAKAAIPTDLAVREAIGGIVETLDARTRQRLADEAFGRLLIPAGSKSPPQRVQALGESNLIMAFAGSPDLPGVDDRVASLWGVFTPAVSAYPMLASLGLGQVLAEISDLAEVFFPSAARARRLRTLQDHRSSATQDESMDRSLLALVGLMLERSLLGMTLAPALSEQLDRSIAPLARWISGSPDAATGEALQGLLYFCSSPRLSTRCANLMCFVASDSAELDAAFAELNDEDTSRIGVVMGCEISPSLRLSAQRKIIFRMFMTLLASVSGSGDDRDADLLGQLAHAVDLFVGMDDDCKDGESPEFSAFATAFSDRLASHRKHAAGNNPCAQNDLFTLIQSNHSVWFGGEASDLEGLERFDVSILLSVNQDGDLDDSDDFGWWKKDSEEFRCRLVELQLRALVDEGFHLQAEALACVYLVTELQVVQRGGRGLSAMARMVRKAVPASWRWIPTLASHLGEAMPSSHLAAKLILRGLAGTGDSSQMDSVRRVAERNLIDRLGRELWMSLPIQMKVAFREREREWLDAQRAQPGTDFGHLCTAYFKPYEAEILGRVMDAFGKPDAALSIEGLMWCQETFGNRFDLGRLTVDGALTLLKAQSNGQVPAGLAERLEMRFRGLKKQTVKLLFALKQLRNDGTHQNFSLDDLRRARDTFINPHCVAAVRDLFYG